MPRQLFTTCLFCLYFLQLTAQADSVRYISYPNNSENKDLYDPALPYNLHAAIRSVIKDIKSSRDYKMVGIFQTDWQQLRQAYGADWCRIPGLEFKITWPDPPRASPYGEDSMNYYDIEYVYPPADTTWFISERYDGLIVKEILQYDSLSQLEQYIPVELILLKNFPELPEPIVTAVIPYEWLYAFPLTMLEQWSQQKSDSLIPALETFLAGAEKEFGPKGFYTLQNSWYMCRENDPRLLNIATKHEKHLICNEYLKTWENFLENLSRNPDVYWHIDSTEQTLINRYGDDSSAYRDGHWVWVTSMRYDSSFYVKSGFENAYYNTLFTYDQLTASWIKQTRHFLLTKTLLPGELPVVGYKKLVYVNTGPEWRSNEHYPPNSEEYILENKRLQYEASNNPLNEYKHPEPPTRFNWEKDLLQHTCNWQLTSNPIR